MVFERARASLSAIVFWFTCFAWRLLFSLAMAHGGGILILDTLILRSRKELALLVVRCMAA